MSSSMDTAVKPRDDGYLEPGTWLTVEAGLMANKPSRRGSISVRLRQFKRHY